MSNIDQAQWKEVKPEDGTSKGWPKLILCNLTHLQGGEKLKLMLLNISGE
jgi:hypothetical protein